MAEEPPEPRQAAVIAVRRRGARSEVCLIRRRGSSSWGIPKGTIERGETAGEAALKEAWEEAGLKGTLAGDSIGIYEYDKLGATLGVAVFVMDVSSEATAWPEVAIRRRRWVALTEAASLLERHAVRPIYERIQARLA
jgi:8-oxo-dGTP pyrophosphatase MutT (NUDIX family)